MKPLLLLLIFLLGYFVTKAQVDPVDPCSHDYSIVYSIVNGYNKTNGYTFGCEAGIWGMNHRLGGDIGIWCYDGKKLSKVPNGMTQPVNTLIIEPYLKATYKLDRFLTEQNDSKFHHAITAYCSIRGNYGLGYCAYYTLATNVAIGIEPNYAFKNGLGANFLITLAFN